MEKMEILQKNVKNMCNVGILRPENAVTQEDLGLLAQRIWTLEEDRSGTPQGVGRRVKQLEMDVDTLSKLVEQNSVGGAMKYSELEAWTKFQLGELSQSVKQELERQEKTCGCTKWRSWVRRGVIYSV